MGSDTSRMRIEGEGASGLVKPEVQMGGSFLGREKGRGALTAGGKRRALRGPGSVCEGKKERRKHYTTRKRARGCPENRKLTEGELGESRDDVLEGGGFRGETGCGYGVIT